MGSQTYFEYEGQVADGWKRSMNSLEWRQFSSQNHINLRRAGHIKADFMEMRRKTDFQDAGDRR